MQPGLKGPLFPYVQECPKCYQIGKYYFVSRDYGDILWEGCETCDGRGYIIPPEWFE